jgi:SAM-dependent methyltransferase
MTAQEWLERVAASQEDRSLRSPHGDLLPAFPPAELQTSTTGLSGRAALLRAFDFYEDVLAGAEASGLQWGDARVLDFGTGWGRVARLFLREVRLDRLYGIDVDPGFVKLCGELFRTPNFTACGPMPPTHFAPATFGAVSAYSVFSHLAPSAADAWMDEFARIVRPGGIVAFTTRDITFLDYIESLSRSPDLAGYQAALVRLFPDHATPRAAYARGEYVFATSLGVSGGGPRDESFYGEAFIPLEYVQSRWASRFELVACCFDPQRHEQRGFVLRRR